jgi:hypothetical protein
MTLPQPPTWKDGAPGWPGWLHEAEHFFSLFSHHRRSKPMSRKNFNAIATAIAQIRNSAERNRVAELLAAVCATLNRRFDRGRFLRACGVA